MVFKKNRVFFKGVMKVFQTKIYRNSNRFAYEEKEATPTHLHLLSNSRAYKKLSSQTFSIQFRFDSIENHMKLFILICLLVNTHAFRVPLPYGNGIQSNGQEGIGINQGIFHHILSWFSTTDKSTPGT